MDRLYGLTIPTRNRRSVAGMDGTLSDTADGAGTAVGRTGAQRSAGVSTSRSTFAVEASIASSASWWLVP